MSQIRSWDDIWARLRDNWVGYVLFIPVMVLYAWAAWYNIWGHHLCYPNLLRILDRFAV